MVVATNYLSELEIAQLSRLVNAYLDVAEDMALGKIPMTMQDWETRLNRFLAATDREVLKDAGKVTAEIARAHAEGAAAVTTPIDLTAAHGTTPAAQHKVTSDDIVIGKPVEFIVLACKSVALRCRLLGTTREITLRTPVRNEGRSH